MSFEQFKALLTAQGNGVTGSSVYPQNYDQRPYMLVQADYGGGVTGNVKIQGRITSTYGWVDLHTFTASGSVELSWFPEVRAVTDTIAGGTVSAGVLG